MKRVFAILLVLVLSLSTLFAFAGCDNNKGYPVEEGATVITVYKHDHMDWENEYFEMAVRKYNENLTDGVQIEYQIIPEANYTDKVKSMREAGKAPEIMEISYGNIFAQEIDFEVAKIAELDKYLSDETKADLTELGKDLITFNGKMYAVPRVLEGTMMLFYNKDLMEQAGAKVPTTWEEMYETCEKLSKVVNQYQRVLGTPLGLATGWATRGAFYNLTGEMPITEDWKESTVLKHKQEYKEFLEYYAGLYENGWASTSDTAGGYNDIILQVCQNKMAMTFAGSYAVSQIVNEAPEMFDKIGIAPMPTKDGDFSKPTNTVGGWEYIVDATAEKKVMPNGKTHAQAAVEFLEWLNRDPEIAGGYFKAAAYSKTSAFNSVNDYVMKDGESSKSPFYQVIKDVTDNAIECPYFAWNITEAHITMIQSVYFGSSTIEEAINECDEQVMKAISINGYRDVAGTKNPK